VTTLYICRFNVYCSAVFQSIPAQIHIFIVWLCMFIVINIPVTVNYGNKPSFFTHIPGYWEFSCHVFGKMGLFLRILGPPRTKNGIINIRINTILINNSAKLEVTRFLALSTKKFLPSQKWSHEVIKTQKRCCF
jgi:hypothetical protein